MFLLRETRPHEIPRNYIFAGRTGTRLNIGRPQVRWIDGVRSAEEIVQLPLTARDGRMLSIANLYQRATSAVRSSIVRARNQFGL